MIPLGRYQCLKLGTCLLGPACVSKQLAEVKRSLASERRLRVAFDQPPEGVFGWFRHSGSMKIVAGAKKILSRELPSQESVVHLHKRIARFCRIA